VSFHSIKIVNVVTIGERQRSVKIRKLLQLSRIYFFYCSQSTGFRRPNEQLSVVVMCFYKCIGIPDNMHKINFSINYFMYLSTLFTTHNKFELSGSNGANTRDRFGTNTLALRDHGLTNDPWMSQRSKVLVRDND